MSEKFKLLEDKTKLSRLLYSNPVCLLTVRFPDGTHNVMTISWVTPTDNRGNIFLSMNKRRYTSKAVQTDSYFVLNVPIAGMEELVMRIGSCSGSTENKFEKNSLPVCRPGWTPALFPSTNIDDKVAVDYDINTSMKKKQKNSKVNENRIRRTAIDNNQIAISTCIAHIVCKVKGFLNPSFDCQDNAISQTSSPAVCEEAHLLISAEISHAYVLDSYWDGSVLAPREYSNEDTEHDNPTKPNANNRNDINNDVETIITGFESVEPNTVPFSTPLPMPAEMGTLSRHSRTHPLPLLSFLGSGRFAYIVPNNQPSIILRDNRDKKTTE